VNKQIENSFPVFFLGVMVGIYGNWLISFFDRLTFPSELNLDFYILFLLTVAAFVIFAAYFISAFAGKYSSNLFWVLHVSLTLACFFFQDSFIRHDPSVLFQNIVFWVLGVIILCIILSMEWISSGRKHRHLIETRWKKPKIGILNDIKWDTTNDEISAWTDISPEEWKAFLKSANFNVEFVTLRDEMDQFAAILNPYGSVYPESDLKNFSTMKDILSFVREGGIFVNVADIPCYYAYDQKLRRKLDTTETFYQIQDNQTTPIRLFTLTPLMKELGLNVFNVSKNPIEQDFGLFSKEKAKIVSERIAIIEPNMRSLIPTIFLNNKDISAFFEVKYGEGDFIFSLIWLKHNLHTQEAKTIIKDAIIKATKDNLDQKCTLHKRAWYQWLAL
jgi:hypothetical protein